MPLGKGLRHLVLLAWAGCAGAWAAPGAHYEGTSGERTEFRFYLHGGALVGQSGSLQAVTAPVHQLRQGRPPRLLAGCVYRFDAADRRRDRIECAETAAPPLGGVASARPAAPSAPASQVLDHMVCMRRCSAQVPRRLRLDAEEDNH